MEDLKRGNFDSHHHHQERDIPPVIEPHCHQVPDEVKGRKMPEKQW